MTQADYINTAMHRNRPPEARTGQLLEVNIVCVYPSDLEKPQNAPLAADAGITSDVWYKYRPTVGHTSDPGTFELPREQIYLLTDDKEVYGRRVGTRLRGAKEGGVARIKVKGIRFREPGWGGGGLFDRRSVMYVFPRFIGPDGTVLDVPPVKYDPPGAYRRDLYIEIGVDDPGGAANQYVKNTTKRKLGHGQKRK